MKLSHQNLRITLFYILIIQYKNGGDKMRIAHIISGLNTGGAERMLLNMIKTCKGRKNSEHIVISISGKGALSNSFIQQGITVKHYDLKSIWGLIELVKLIFFVARENVDIIQTWLYHGDLIGGIVGKILGIPVVWGIHNSHLDAKGKISTKYVLKLDTLLSYYIPVKIVSCSHYAAHLHYQLGYRDIFHVIPNGFDIKKYQPNFNNKSKFAKKYHIEGKKIIGFVARFDALKDFPNFIKAMGKIISQNNGVQVVMCGKNVDYSNDELKKNIIDNGIYDNVILMGERNDINNVLVGLDFLVLSSKSEAFPMVLGEAMSCGVPCITTDVGDAKYIVGDTGICVDKENSECLAQGIIEALNWSSKLYKEKSRLARHRIESEFSLEKVVDKYMDLYSEVVKI